MADAASGRRNEKVRRVMASYIDEIVVWPSTKTGVLRVNAALAGVLGLDGVPEVAAPEVGGRASTAAPPSGHTRRKTGSTEWRAAGSTDRAGAPANARTRNDRAPHPLGKNSEVKKHTNPPSGGSRVDAIAGAGFEPATSGL